MLKRWGSPSTWWRRSALVEGGTLVPRDSPAGAGLELAAGIDNLPRIVRGTVRVLVQRCAGNPLGMGVVGETIGLVFGGILANSGVASAHAVLVSANIQAGQVSTGNN
jgi:hypothetical protein